MTLRKTDRPGQFYDDVSKRMYEIYDVYPKVLTVRTEPGGFRLRPQRGEQFLIVGFGCAANPVADEGNLLMEVQLLRAFDVPIRTLRDDHAPSRRRRRARRSLREPAVPRPHLGASCGPAPWRSARRSSGPPLACFPSRWCA